jgi:hypothetical protein
MTRILLLLLVGCGLVLFALSNLSPVLAVVFLGMKTVALPLAAWMGIAIASGAITSFCLQFLNYLQRAYSTPNPEEVGDIPHQTRPFYRESPETPEPEPQPRYTPPPESTPNSYASDWEEGSNENWDFDAAPATPRANSPNFNRARSTGTPQTPRTTYEVNQEPKTKSQTGSVYSYSYREPTDSGVGRTDAVYDANYRVINPPDQPTPEPEDDDDWGFEDDEDFDHEGKSRPQR